MKTSIFLYSSLLESIGLSESVILQAARKAVFTVREPRKIGPIAMLNAVCFESTQGTCSYNDVASRIDYDSDNIPSRQAVGKRMNDSCLLFFQNMLAQAIHHKTNLPAALSNPEFLEKYTRVIVQDSTIVKLPQWLFEQYSGVSNAHTAVCNARIQAVYDIKNMVFIAFSIDPYSKNDLTSAPELELREGDLVLRDRGYLISDEISRHIKIGADCIYRHKTGTIYLDPQTGTPINLLAKLKKQNTLDVLVQLNNDERTVVRLVAAPVNEETANIRRMKAKRQTKGHAPSKEVLALMGWTIFITTISSKEADFEQIFLLYGLRWRIEIIFKAWKSHMKFDVIHRVSKTQFIINLCARLLIITASTSVIYKHCYLKLKKMYNRELSLLKFLNYIMKKPQKIQLICRCLDFGNSLTEDIWTVLKKYCCYEKRNRKNFNQTCDAFA